MLLKYISSNFMVLNTCMHVCHFVYKKDILQLKVWYFSPLKFLYWQLLLVQISSYFLIWTNVFLFSEITHRFQTAKPAVRQTLLKYLLPWLHNMELVDPTLPQSNTMSMFILRFHDNYTETFKPPLKGEGWGSQEATKMVLNNLFYITVKVGSSLQQWWFSLTFQVIKGYCGHPVIGVHFSVRVDVVL